MTTIVVDRKLRQMAADCQATGSDNFKSKVRKIYSVGNEVLIAGAGSVEAILSFVKWYGIQLQVERGMKIDGDKDTYYPKTDDFHALVLHKGGELAWYAKAGIPVDVKERFFGIGSGSGYALGALYAGADLKEAVRIAARLDCKTGLGIQLEGFNGA